MDSALFSSDTLTNDGLFAGRPPAISRKVTLLAGQSLGRGAVLGKITATGKYTLSASASTDGSEVPDAILAQAADATSADAECLIYEDGVFNETQLILGTGHTTASIHAGLRGKGILLAGATAVVNP